MDRCSITSLFIDAVLIIGIIGCGYNIIWRCYKDTPLRWADTDDVEVFENDSKKENLHPLRDCNASPTNTIQLAVDLSYSNEIPLQPVYPSEIEKIGDTLLNKLFTACTCNNTDNECFQWTLTINELNYSKSDFGHCGRGTNTDPQPAETCVIPEPVEIPHERVNTTIAKIFILGRAGLKRSQCFANTVQCALRSTKQKLFSTTEEPYILTIVNDIDISGD